MVDTIKFSINCVHERYLNILKILKTRTIDKKYTVTDYSDLGKDTRRKYLRGQIYIPSSSRNINWMYERELNKIVFEFSIPKACYGTNIYQFVRHRSDGDFNLFEWVSMRNKGEQTYYRLMQFFKRFFFYELENRLVSEAEYIKAKNDLSGWQDHSLISMQDVEIERIDICFNKIFKDENKCLAYLEHLKSLHKKRSSVEKDRRAQIYENGLYMVSEYYTWKIYWKGYEFKVIKNGVSDRNELQRINNEKGKVFYEVEKMQDFADRILRYEIEFKRGSMNYIYKTKLYKRKSKEYNKFRIGHNKYLAIDTKEKKLWDIRKDIVKLNLYLIKLGAKSFKEALQKLGEEKKPFKASYDFYSKSQGQVSSFYLEVTQDEMLRDEVVSRDEIEGIVYGKDFKFNKNALFGRDLVVELMNRFKEFMSEFQLKEIPEGLQNSRMIIRDFEKFPGAKKLSFGFKRFLRCLDTMSMDQVKRSGEFERTSIYRYEKRLKEIGITREHRLKTGIWSSQDFEEYYFNVHTADFEKNVNSRFFRL